MQSDLCIVNDQSGQSGLTTLNTSVLHQAQGNMCMLNQSGLCSVLHQAQGDLCIVKQQGDVCVV